MNDALPLLWLPALTPNILNGAVRLVLIQSQKQETLLTQM